MRSLKERIFSTSQKSNRILNMLNAADRTQNRSIMSVGAHHPNFGQHAGGFNR